MSDSNNCLTDEELTSLLRWEELGDRRRVLMLHLDRCPGCRMVLAEAVQHLSSRRFAYPRAWVCAVAAVSALVLALVALWIFSGA